MTKPLPEILRCDCGRKVDIRKSVLSGRYYANCLGDSARGFVACWAGPERKTERGAIEAWNRVMGGEK